MSASPEYKPNPSASLSPSVDSAVATPRKRQTSAGSPSTPKRSKKEPKGKEKETKPPGSGGRKKARSWSKKEVRELWDAMGFLPVKVKWDDVSSKVEGRDKLSCKNKWTYDMLPKLNAFIDSLGE
ncbi:hypothetical protein P7C73_g2103, partial [Tremellales sp. Uapishka_1]